MDVNVNSESFKQLDKNSKREVCLKIYDEARSAGLAAAAKHTPIPMVVQQHENMLDDNSPVVYREVVNDGVCGFAWVIVKPANSVFAKVMKESNLGKNDVYGGIYVWVSDFNQSMSKKETYAYAFADVLKKYGINAYAQSRMD